MTLVAAFRCPAGGILLCADREENYGDTKREIGKIFTVELPTLQVFIAGSGPTSVVSQAFLEINQALILAFSNGEDMVKVHKRLVEETLKSIHERYADNLKEWDLGLMVIFAPYDRSMVPLLYRSEYSMLVSEPFYVGYGAGKALSDYLADRLYDYERIDRQTLIAVAAFIFREVERSVGGVGLGVDMVFIREGNPFTLKIGKDNVKAIQEQIPPLGECVVPYWKDRVAIPRILVPE